VVVDIIITSLKTRFEYLEVFESIFRFLFDVKMLKSLDNNKLKKSYTIFGFLRHCKSYKLSL
jgi:hypothetical protein